MSFTYDENDPLPTWVKNAVCRWKEDDASRAAHDDTREQLADAWTRLFGEDLPQKETARESIDLGDCFMWLFSGGKIIESSYEGDAIYELIDAVTAKSTAPVQEESICDSEDPDARGDAPSSDDRVNTYIVNGRPLSEDQTQAINTLLDAIDRGERVLVLTGAAGTGKTTSAQALADQLWERGFSVEFLAPTGKAAVRISEVVGRPAKTIHSRLYRSVKNTEDGVPIFLHPHEDMSEGRSTAYISDEGSMVGSRLHEALVKALGPKGILIYLADPHQLPPVADKWGPDLENPTAELSHIHRQAAESPVLQVATILRNGGTMPRESIGNSYIRRQGTLQVAATWMVEQMNAGEDAVVLCYSNKTRNKINKLVRYLLGHDKRGPLVLGERLICLRNNRHVGCMNGQTMSADQISWFGDPKDNIVKVRTRQDLRFFTSPDLIAAERTAFEYRSRMGEFKGAQPQLWLHLDYAYALTVHRSQGSEYRKVLFVIDNTMRYMWRAGKLKDGHRICYTAVTRAKEQLTVLDVK